METGFSERPLTSAKDTALTEIEYVLDAADHIACRMFLEGPSESPHPRYRSLRAGDLFLVLIVLLLGAVLLWNNRDQTLLVTDLIVTLAVLLLWIILLLHGPSEPPRDRRLVVTEEVEKLRALGVVRVGRRDRISMDDGGFTEVNEYRNEGTGVVVVERRETRVPWSEVESIVVADRHAIFTVRANGYLFVPRRAFGDEAAFIRFVATAVWRRHFSRQPIRGEITLGPVARPDGRIQSSP